MKKRLFRIWMVINSIFATQCSAQISTLEVFSEKAVKLQYKDSTHIEFWNLTGASTIDEQYHSNLFQFYSRRYDQSGRIIEERAADRYGGFKHYYKKIYGANGLDSVKFNFNKIKTLTSVGRREYDDQNRMVKYTLADTTGDIYYQELTQYTGNESSITSIREIDYTGKEWNSSVYRKYEDNKTILKVYPGDEPDTTYYTYSGDTIIERDHNYIDGKLYFITITKHNGKDEVYLKELYREGELDELFSTVYKNGLPQSSVKIDSYGKRWDYSYSYVFDGKGNWTYQIITINNKLMYRIKRGITYF